MPFLGQVHSVLKSIGLAIAGIGGEMGILHECSLVGISLTVFLTRFPDVQMQKRPDPEKSLKNVQIVFQNVQILEFFHPNVQMQKRPDLEKSLKNVRMQSGRSGQIVRNGYLYRPI